MARRKGKSVTFDAMVKFVIRQYNIPTRKDVDRLMVRLDRLEKLIKAGSPAKDRQIPRSGRGRPTRRSAITASDTVLEVIGRFKNGVGFADIQAKTGFGEKKIRNIIFRLDKLGKIKRVNRGIYVVAEPSGK